MLKNIQICLRVVLVTLVLTGVLYPLCVTVVAKAVFPQQANGGIVTDSDGKPCGSKLIAQSFASPQYFQPRPSAVDLEASPLVSGGSNWGPGSEKLHERMQADRERLLRENPNADREIPVELLTASGSGLDPHLSIAAAKWQIPRVAKARNVEAAEIERLLERHIEPRPFGVLGEPCVNVLELNMALDQ